MVTSLAASTFTASPISDPNSAYPLDELPPPNVNAPPRVKLAPLDTDAVSERPSGSAVAVKLLVVKVTLPLVSLGDNTTLAL